MNDTTNLADFTNYTTFAISTSTISPNVTVSTNSFVSTTVIGRTVNNTAATADDSVLIQNELVVIGAAVSVGILAVVAVILRILMPMFRSKMKKSKREKLLKQKEREAREGQPSGQYPAYSNSPALHNSHSSRSSSGQWEWADNSSSQTRSTYYSSEGRLKTPLTSQGNLRGSSLSLPVYLPDDRNSHKGSPSINDRKKLNDDLVSMLSSSTKSLDPVKLGDAYRTRWDNEFDPYGSMPRSSLSSVMHPSEDRRIPDPPGSTVPPQHIQYQGDWYYPSMAPGNRYGARRPQMP